jgi:hypothetical protein
MKLLGSASPCLLYGEMRMMQESTLATFSRKKLVGSRQIYYSQFHIGIMSQSNTDAAFTNASSIIGSTIDWVDNPNIFVGKVMSILFLAEKARVG